MSICTALVGGDFKGNTYEQESSRDPCEEGALKAGREVRVVCVPCETVVPQLAPAALLHVIVYVIHNVSLIFLELLQPISP